MSLTSPTFHLFKSKHLGTYWSDLSDFCINTTMGSQSIIFQSLDDRNFFRRAISEKKIKFLDLLEGKGYICESCLCSKPGNAHVSALIDGTPFSWAACFDSFCWFFFGQFLSQKEPDFLDFFRNSFHIPHYLLRFLTLTLNFYRTICRIRLLIA